MFFQWQWESGLWRHGRELRRWGGRGRCIRRFPCSFSSPACHSHYHRSNCPIPTCIPWSPSQPTQGKQCFPTKQTIKKSIKINRYLDFIHKLVFSLRIEEKIVYVELESTRPRHPVVILENQNQGLIVKFSEVQG